MCLSSATLLHPTQRVKIFGNIFAPSNGLGTWAVCVRYAWIRKVSKNNNNNKGWYFENIENINNIMIFSDENIMIYCHDIYHWAVRLCLCHWYTSLIYITDIFVPTLITMERTAYVAVYTCRRLCSVDKCHRLTVYYWLLCFGADLLLTFYRLMQWQL